MTKLADVATADLVDGLGAFGLPLAQMTTSGPFWAVLGLGPEGGGGRGSKHASSAKDFQNGVRAVGWLPVLEPSLGAKSFESERLRRGLPAEAEQSGK